MLRICVLALSCLAGSVVFGQTVDTPTATDRYYVVFLRPDPSRQPLPKEEGERIQAAHMANILKMADEGILRSAGPFDDTPTTISGIFVFRTDSLSTAQAIAARDPTVLEHRNTVDVHGWDGPAGIGVEYFRLHKLDPKTPENMQIHPLCILSKGSAWEERSHDPEFLSEHQRYVDRLRKQGKLSAAGRIEAPDSMIELVIFRPGPMEAAQRLLQEDPAIQAGAIQSECHHWWSSDHVLPW